MLSPNLKVTGIYDSENMIKTYHSKDIHSVLDRQIAKPRIRTNHNINEKWSDQKG